MPISRCHPTHGSATRYRKTSSLIQSSGSPELRDSSYRHRKSRGPSRVTTVSAEPVALIPQCEECNKVWLPTEGETWQAHWIDDGPDEKLVFYCWECAEREFGR